VLDLKGHVSGTPLEDEMGAGWDVPARRRSPKMDTNQLGNTVRDMEERVEAQVKDATRRAQTAAEKVLALARENPGLSLVAAFGLGYLIARVARRS